MIATKVNVKIDVDKSNIMDVVLEYENEANKSGLKLEFNYPSCCYMFKVDHQSIKPDKNILFMFECLVEKLIFVLIETCLKPNHIYKLVLNFIRM